MTPMAATPDPPDPRFPVYDPHPHPLDLLACWLFPALGDPHWSTRPCIREPEPEARCDRAAAARRDYGPVQLADHLGLARWQLDRALADGLIPGPGPAARTLVRGGS